MRFADKRLSRLSICSGMCKRDASEVLDRARAMAGQVRDLHRPPCLGGAFIRAR